MMGTSQTLQERAASAPKQIQSYLFSIKAAEINAQIFTVAGLEASAYLELSKIIAEIILKSLPVSVLEEKISSLVSWPQDKISSLAVEIAGARLLVCDNWLGGEVEKYLRSKSVDISRYAALVAEQQLAIAKEEDFFREQIEENAEESGSGSMEDVLDDDFVNEIEDGADDENDDETNDEEKKEPSSNLDIPTEKKSLLTLLSEGVLGALQSELENIERYNYLFVRVWSEDDAFRLEAQNSLFANQENISLAKIELDGRPKIATIAVLLKKFVKKYGLDANDLNIAEYVSSPDLKDFSDDEKALSLRVLKFFRNINKLDEYLAQQAAGQIEGFEVLPLAANQPAPIFAKSSTVRPIIPVAPTSPIKPTSPIETIKSAESVLPISVGLAAELEMMLQDYAPGSLEYKTLQQELKRLEQKK